MPPPTREALVTALQQPPASLSVYVSNQWTTFNLFSTFTDFVLLLFLQNKLGERISIHQL